MVILISAAPWVALAASADEHQPDKAATPGSPGGPPAPGEEAHDHPQPRNVDEARRYYNPQNDPDISVHDNGDGRWRISHVTRKSSAGGPK